MDDIVYYTLKRSYVGRTTISLSLPHEVPTWSSKAFLSHRIAYISRMFCKCFDIFEFNTQHFVILDCQDFDEVSKVPLTSFVQVNPDKVTEDF